MESYSTYVRTVASLSRRFVMSWMDRGHKNSGCRCGFGDLFFLTIKKGADVATPWGISNEASPSFTGTPNPTLSPCGPSLNSHLISNSHRAYSSPVSTRRSFVFARGTTAGQTGNAEGVPSQRKHVTKQCAFFPPLVGSPRGCPKGKQGENSQCMFCTWFCWQRGRLPACLPACSASSSTYVRVLTRTSRLEPRRMGVLVSFGDASKLGGGEGWTD